MPVGAAVGLGAAATIYSADKASNAASDAAKAQAKSGDQSIAYQRETRDMALERLSPFLNFATGSMSQANAPVAPTQDFNNFDAQAYLAANPDVANNWVGHYGKGTAQGAWEHYQQYGKNEGRAFTPVANAQTSPGGGGGFAADSPMAKYLELLDPNKQADYLTKNPIFQAAINQFGTKAKNTLGFGGLKGDLANAVTQSYVASGNTAIDTQLNRLLNPIQIGQASAAGQANTLLSSGQSIGNTMTDVGNAKAAGLIGSANATTQGVNSLLNAGAQLGGAYYGNKARAS